MESRVCIYEHIFDYIYSSYGESPFVAFQDCVIVFHILLYGRGKRDAVKFLSIYLVVMGYILSPFVSLSLLFVLQNINTIIVISGKVSTCIMRLLTRMSIDKTFSRKQNVWLCVFSIKPVEGLCILEQSLLKHSTKK